jgi:hypothetical protein
MTVGVAIRRCQKRYHCCFRCSGDKAEILLALLGLDTRECLVVLHFKEWAGENVLWSAAIPNRERAYDPLLDSEYPPLLGRGSLPGERGSDYSQRIGWSFLSSLVRSVCKIYFLAQSLLCPHKSNSRVLQYVYVYTLI